MPRYRQVLLLLRVTVFTQQTQPPREAPQTRFAGDFSSIAFALTLMFVVRGEMADRIQRYVRYLKFQ